MAIIPSTYSLMKINQSHTKIGVVTQSKYLAIGGLVHVYQPDVGLVVTQGWPSPATASKILSLINKDTQTIDFNRLLAADPDAAYRQFGILTTEGCGFAYTGPQLNNIKGAIVTDNSVALGNFLANEQVLPAMIKSSQHHPQENLLDDLYGSIMAGLHQGGEQRGQQSAAIKVWDIPSGSPQPEVDLRVDDSSLALEDLEKLIEKHHLYFDCPNPNQTITYDQAAILLHKAQALTPDVTLTTMYDLFRLENLEGRWLDNTHFDQIALAFLEDKYLN